MRIKAILFDLDGTLLDTAIDLANAVKSAMLAQHLPPPPFEVLRANAGKGLKALFQAGMLSENDPRLPSLIEAARERYAATLTTHTALFPGMEKVLQQLQQHALPWGIVTNKPMCFTKPLLAHFKPLSHAGCVIAGDTLPVQKPDPMPILKALTDLNVDPEEALYIGDTVTDVMAASSANVKTLLALYGYIGKEEDPYTFGAYGYLNQPIDLLDWLGIK